MVMGNIMTKTNITHTLVSGRMINHMEEDNKYTNLVPAIKVILKLVRKMD
jgi:hypothetical protein